MNQAMEYVFFNWFGDRYLLTHKNMLVIQVFACQGRWDAFFGLNWAAWFYCILYSIYAPP